MEDLLTCCSLAMRHAEAGGGPAGAGDEPPTDVAGASWAHEPVFMLEVPKNWSYVLLDCFLLLLRQPWEPLPAAPVRDAVEAAFRLPALLPFLSCLSSHHCLPPSLIPRSSLAVVLCFLDDLVDVV